MPELTVQRQQRAEWDEDGEHEEHRGGKAEQVNTRSQILENLRQRILSGLHLGTLAPGDRLPSTRELAATLGVAPRTVIAAYRALEGEGIVEMRPRSGIYVTRGSASERAMLPQLANWVVDVLVQSVSRGIPPREFPERVRRCIDTLRLRAACIECNADQIHSICTELYQDYGLESDPVDLDRLNAGDRTAMESIRNADVLITTSSHAVDVQRFAELVKRPSIIVSLRAEMVEEMVRLLGAGPVYFVCSDPRFVRVIGDVLEPSGHGDNVHAIVVGQDDLDSIPGGAPTYLTSSARKSLGERQLSGRIVPTPRVFSTQSARELLSFIVSRNMSALQSLPA